MNPQLLFTMFFLDMLYFLQLFEASEDCEIQIKDYFSDGSCTHFSNKQMMNSMICHVSSKKSSSNMNRIFWYKLYVFIVARAIVCCHHHSYATKQASRSIEY